MQPDVGAYQKEHLKKLAEQKNTVVFEVEHDNVANPWKNEKMRVTVETLMKKVMEGGQDAAGDPHLIFLRERRRVGQ